MGRYFLKNFLIHYISEIGSRGNIYAGRLRFLGSLCIRVQRNVMSIDLCSPVRFSRSHTSNSETPLNKIACVPVIRRQPQLT